MMLKLQSYDLKVTFVPGKLFIIADTLSRAALKITQVDEIENDIILHVQNLIQNIAISKNKLYLIKKETQSDFVCKTLNEVIHNGWTGNKNSIEEIIKPYWTFKEDLCVIDDLIFKNKSLLIPKNLRPEMLKIVHEDHIGIERCKNSIKDLIFWPT